jgi:hypothetical protein
MIEISGNLIPYPIMFNPLKHHLLYIKEIIKTTYSGELLREIISHAGTSVTDIYTGHLDIESICNHVIAFLSENSLNEKNSFCQWAGDEQRDFKKIILPDQSEWTLKYFDDNKRFVHLFPARYSINSLRVKASSLKTVIFWLSQKDVDYIDIENLNFVRRAAGLSPVKSLEDVKAITHLVNLMK